MTAISRPAGLALVLLLCATRAEASVEISTAPTSNMNCSAGVCTPTAKDAVLNVNDLAAMLSSADTTVETANGAITIDVTSPLSWASTRRLALDASHNINIKAPVMAEGTAGLTINTNGSGAGGGVKIFSGGKIAFWDLSSSLIIDGQNYTLFGDVSTLAADIAANPSGLYALANDYDASSDGMYSKSPISSSTFTGTVEGLGNTIVNLTIQDQQDLRVGLFDYIFHATVRDLGVVNASVSGAAKVAVVGILAGEVVEDGTIVQCYSTGQVNGTGKVQSIGGLVGLLGGQSGHNARILRSYSTANAAGGDLGGFYGGLIGESGEYTVISESYATGSAAARTDAFAGGLAGLTAGRVLNSYAIGSSRVGSWDHNSTPPPATGGLIAYAFGGHLVRASYSIGRSKGGESAVTGGLVGYGGAKFVNSYWDIDTSGHTQSGGGQGLTDAQLKSGLPAGFDPKIWAQSAGINNGYPYLIANPPQ